MSFKVRLLGGPCDGREINLAQIRPIQINKMVIGNRFVNVIKREETEETSLVVAEYKYIPSRHDDVEDVYLFRYAE